MEKAKTIVMLVAGVLVGGGLGLFLLFGLGLGGFGAQNQPASGGGAPNPAGPNVNQPAPTFELATLDSGALDLADLRGQVVLLNFWATWCGPCRLEMPLFEDLQQQTGDRLKVVAVNADEPDAQVQAFVDELGLTFTVGLDPGQAIGDLYRVRVFPTTFLIDEAGIVRVQHLGVLDEGQLSVYLTELGVLE